MVNKMDGEKKASPLPEDLPEEALSEKPDLPEKLSSILDGEVIYTDESRQAQRDENYVYVHRGEALNEEELFQLSAREDIRRVLIAGPHFSGKTTLIVMLYYMFLEGHNRALRFGGSLTMEGFKSRAKKTRLASGEAKPVIDRTSRSAQDRYLHLALVDMDGRKSNLILTDISGELFTLDYAEDLGELYGSCENVFLTVDGDKLKDPMQRQNENMLTILLLKNLLRSGVVTKRSKLQVICTKQDLIEATEQLEDTTQYLGKKQDSMRAKYAEKVSSLDFHMISALKLDEETQKKLEQIILKCIESGEPEAVIPLEEPKLQRYFDKFKMRG